MKVPSTSTIRHTLAAVSLAAVVALAGCTGDEGQDASSGPSDGGGDTAAVSDGGGQPQADVSDVPDVVATVNGEEITKDEFVQAYETQFQQASSQQQSTGQELDQDELKQQVADQLVDNRLLLQAADDAGIEPTEDDIDAQLDEIAAQNGLGSGDEVVSALEQQGMTEEDVRADAASQFKLTTFIEQEADISEPSEEELKEQYDQLVEQQASSGGQQSEVPPFEEVRDQLADQSVTQQRNEAATQIASDLREQGDVTINL